ncbi:GCN5-related N-acetyltransferas-like protein [Boeremia exigua]|uniref:GCN5-related N-acetyltransferase-like protein n=1 Tax=Boeremia exigua TaxID=749465 RepID=UPI001E8E7F2D|nr:GCN5-related N-acetyltransferase-like protein [Boeremia exigua]KAH6643990.1 GCN5-related N-acetyltransferas-like protein [Boeremia exigua]
MSVPFVRRYDPTRDFENGLHVFFATIEPKLDWEPTRTIGSYLWYRVYVYLASATCFVLDDGNGRAVGYCIGTADTSKFAEKWREEFVPTVDLEQVPKPGVQTEDPLMEKEETRGFRQAVHNAECSGLQAWPKELAKYPAHMHIDILPEFQRKGWGSILINQLFDAVKREGAPGIHLDMVRWNTTGKSFYKKIGFENCSLVLDDGKSGETGVNDIVLTLVKSF